MHRMHKSMQGGPGHVPSDIFSSKRCSFVHSRVFLAQISSRLKHIFLEIYPLIYLFYMLFTFSVLIIINNYYWCGIIPHHPILLVRHATQTESIGVAEAIPATPLSIPMISYFSMKVYCHNYKHLMFHVSGHCQFTG